MSRVMENDGDEFEALERYAGRLKGNIVFYSQFFSRREGYLYSL